MVNDEESRHALASEETPLLAESGIGETTASAGQNGYEDEDDVAPTPLAGKRAVVVAFAVVCLLFIQGMITESGRLRMALTLLQLPILHRCQRRSQISPQTLTLSRILRG
jgi:hypothetical protein